MKRTWRFVKDIDNLEDVTAPPILGAIMDAEDFHIARIWSDVPEAEANARLIVIACNNFWAVVENLQIADKRLSTLLNAWKTENPEASPLLIEWMQGLVDESIRIKEVLAKIEQDMEDV